MSSKDRQVSTTDNRMLKNTIILFVALGVSKLIGAFLKIPLTNIIGGLGMGYFSTANSLFSPIYAIAVAALPTMMMRLTAQNAAVGRFKDVRRIRKAGLFAAVGLGLTGTAGMLMIAAPFANRIASSPGSYLPILAIAPSLFFCAVSAVYKGYYEGLSNMIPTAVSQIVEAVVKSTVGLGLAWLTLANGGSAAHAAAAAIGGITISEFFGMAFLFLRGRGRDGITAEQLQSSPPPRRKRELIKMLMHQSLPITIAALAMNLNPFIDMMTIPAIINATVADNAAFYRQNFMLGNLDNIGNFIYGSYTGIAIPIFALATTVTALVCKSALPEITAAYEACDLGKLKSALRGLFKGTFMVGLPISLGIAALANPILSLLYFTRPAEVAVSTPPLMILGLGGIPLLLSGVLFGIFLSICRTDLQIKLMLGGAFIKLAGNVALVRIPQLGVNGAAVATILCYTFVSVAGLILLNSTLKPCFGGRTAPPLKSFAIARLILQPLSFAKLCAVTAYVCYYHVFEAGYGGITRLAASVATAGIVYLSLTMFADKKYIGKLMTTMKKSSPL